MRQRPQVHLPRKNKLPPMLEIDEDGIPVAELDSWMRPRWSSDEDVPSMQLGDWPEAEE
jgi:hypothetical protein